MMGKLYITKKLGYILQVLVIYVIQSALYYEIYVTNMQPIHSLLREIGPYEVPFNLLTGLPLYFGVNIYYVLACVLHPGKSTGLTGDSHCNLCYSTRSVRTSHCARCSTCVVAKDHHCDFTNKCIGAGNFKCFYWFLTSALLGCFHFLVRSCQWFYYWYSYREEMGENTVLKSYSATYIIVFALHVYCLNAFFLLICKLWINATMNLCFNLTTIDTLGFYERPSICSSTVKEPVNSFDMGCLANWIQFFGSNPLTWLSFSPSLRLQSTYLPSSPELTLEYHIDNLQPELLDSGIRFKLFHLSEKTDKVLSNLEVAKKKIYSNI